MLCFWPGKEGRLDGQQRKIQRFSYAHSELLEPYSKYDRASTLSKGVWSEPLGLELGATLPHGLRLLQRLDFGKPLLEIRPCQLQALPFPSLTFDATLGFPGEGPGLGSVLSFPDFGLQLSDLGLTSAVALCPLALAWIFCGLLTLFWVLHSWGHHGFQAWTSTRKTPLPHDRRLSAPTAPTSKVWFWVLVLIGSHSPRGDLELPFGHPVLEVTQKAEGQAADVLMTTTPDVEMVNTLLEQYGRELYGAGRPYNHYSETVNAVQSKRPRLRRCCNQRGTWPTHGFVRSLQVIIWLFHGRLSCHSSHRHGCGYGAGKQE